MSDRLTAKQLKALSVGLVHAWRIVSEAYVSRPVPDSPSWLLFISRRSMWREAYELGRLQGLQDAIQVIRNELEPAPPTMAGEG